MKTKSYLLLTLSTAIVAYSLYFIFALCYRQPMGGYNLFESYLFGFILHIPLWFVIFMIGGIFYKVINKLKNIKSTIKIIGIIVFIMLVIPVIVKEFSENFDYLVLLFYTVDFILCYIIMSKIINDQNTELAK
jgi:hypothetical protein